MVIFILALVTLTSSNGEKTETNKMEIALADKLAFSSGYSEVNEP